MKFAVTFQQRYRWDEHPIISGVTHKSYLVVEATDEIQARGILFAVLRNDWAFTYRLDERFFQDIERYDLKKLPYEIRPATGHDCNFAWYKDGEWIGCICGLKFIGVA